MFNALPPQLYIPAKPAIIRAHQGDLNALEALEREKGIRAVLPGTVPAHVQGAKPTPTFSWINSYSSSSDLTTYNYSVTLPTGGMLVVATAGRNGNNDTLASSITVGGLPLVLHVNHNGDTGTYVTIGSRYVPAGTYTLSITYTHASLRNTAFVWLVTNFTYRAPSHTAVMAASSAGSVSVTINISRPAFTVMLGTLSTASQLTLSGINQRDRFVVENWASICGEAVDAGSGNTSRTCTVSPVSSSRVAGAVSW